MPADRNPALQAGTRSAARLTRTVALEALRAAVAQAEAVGGPEPPGRSPLAVAPAALRASAPRIGRPRSGIIQERKTQEPDLRAPGAVGPEA
jgi:hypothetical protein